MTYFKASEVAKLYKVGKRTVYHWIESAKSERLDLELVEYHAKTYIANTIKNQTRMKELSVKGKKYKNRKLLKIVTPKDEFYKIFSEEQIIDLIRCIEINKEIPVKYCYLASGASSWDKYAKKKWENSNATNPQHTEQLLDFIDTYLTTLIKTYDYVNVIDIGPGNGLPVKKGLARLIEKNLLGKYIALDFSSDILEIVEKNMKTWFGNEFPFEGQQIDITTDTFHSLLVKNTEFNKKNVNGINLILFLGGTIENDKYAAQLNIISKSMGLKDLFILEQWLDTEIQRMRLYFIDNAKLGKNSDLAHRKLVLDLLNISEECYEVERFYSTELRAKIIRINFTTDMKIEIKTTQINKTIAIDNKDYITIWRQNTHNTIEIINELSNAGLEIKSVNSSIDGQSIMIASQIRPVE